MSIEQIQGQQRAKRFLSLMIRKSQVPHAFLFSGMAGIGKRAMALEIAKTVNCLAPRGEDSCDACSSCRKAGGETHPDILFVRAQGAFIKVDQIRELKERVRFRPFEARLRVVIIEEAQHLKEEAANAILKILEEPPRQNLFILTALEPQMLLPTIVSRCCHIRFQPLDDQSIEVAMTAKGHLAAERARKWAPLAGGSLERARKLVDGRWIEHIQEVFADLERLCEVPMADFFTITSQWVKRTEDLEQDLECIKLLVCAWVSAKLNLPSTLPIERGAGTIAEQADSASVETLLDLYDQAEEALQRIRYNANKHLALEYICLAIRKGLNGESDWNPLPSRR